MAARKKTAATTAGSRAPALATAEKKPSVTSTLSWKLARTDLSCGHSVTRLPEHNRQEEIWCLGCEAWRKKTS